MPKHLVTIIAAGLLARLLALAMQPDLHPDAFFQYLEPAWGHLNGYWWQAWEWRDGIRSWVIPFYHAGWITGLKSLGITYPMLVLKILMVQWMLWSLLAVYGAYLWVSHLGGKRAGLLAALLLAVSPWTCYFAGQTLTEVIALPLFVCGFAAWTLSRNATTHEQRLALIAGLLLGLGACIRIPQAPLLMIPWLDWLVRRRWRVCLYASLGLLPALLLFGVVDWATWGTPWHSAWGFIRYNFIEGRSVDSGVSPYEQHALRLYDQLSWGLVVCLGFIVVCWRRAWTAALPALLLFGLMSSQPHQEDRHAVMLIPLLLIAFSAAVAPYLSWSPAMSRSLRVLRLAVPSLFVLCVVLQGMWSIHQRPILDFSHRWGLYEGQAWVGQQTDVTGVLVEGRFHLSGGYFMLGVNRPMESFAPGQLVDRRFNYVVAAKGSPVWRIALDAGFNSVFQSQGFEVMRRF